VDGLLDWYLFGVAAGLGVAAGIAVVWVARRAPLRPLALVLAAAAAVAVVAIGVLAVGWALVGGGVGLALSAASARRLAPAALPAAGLVAAALAAIPLVGFLEALLAPVLGARLGRRADTRHAGLRVLARD
jgi:predicted TIM-barrel enzyme